MAKSRIPTRDLKPATQALLFKYIRHNSVPTGHPNLGKSVICPVPLRV
jgi:hypothetical protein